jgi:hypothetical protein
MRKKRKDVDKRECVKHSDGAVNTTNNKGNMTKQIPQDLIDFVNDLGDGSKIIRVNGHKSALLEWPDKSRGLVRWSAYCQKWTICDGNGAYQSGYAYASGYKD